MLILILAIAMTFYCEN